MAKSMKIGKSSPHEENALVDAISLSVSSPSPSSYASLLYILARGAPPPPLSTLPKVFEPVFLQITSKRGC